MTRRSSAFSVAIGLGDAVLAFKCTRKLAPKAITLVSVMVIEVWASAYMQRHKLALALAARTYKILEQQKIK